MPEKFQNKYRTTSTRLQNWDYRWSAAYFVTICTQNREHFFGEIEEGNMRLSGVGIIANVLWHEIKNHAKNVTLGAFVVMPNHIHGIIIINNPVNPELNAGANTVTNEQVNGMDTNVVANANVNATTNANANVEARHALPLPPPQPPPQPPPPHTPQPPQPPPGQKRFQNQGKNSLSAMVGSYKSAVTKHANRLGMPFAWQTRFHDHIIRSSADFERISNYIHNNPRNWAEDKFYASN